MLQLETLTFKNIRCFDKEQSVSLVNRNKLIQVDGRNENTGGSSGAGKTTVFLALDYLLGINDIPTTVLQSRLTKETIEVTGTFTIDEKPVKITRSKKSGLTIKTEEGTTSGNVKLAEEKLDELIGIPKKVFKKMIHKKQKEGGFFLDMTAKETYEFMVTMLGLNTYIEKQNLIHENERGYEKEISDISTALEARNSSIQSLEYVLTSKEKPKATVTKEECERLKQGLEEIEQRIVDINEAKRQEIDKVPEPVKTASTFDVSMLNQLKAGKVEFSNKIKRVQEKRKSFETELSNMAAMKVRAQTIGQSIADTKAQIKQIEHAGTCPTCHQDWNSEKAKESLIAMHEKVGALTDEALTIKKELERESDLTVSIGRLSNIEQDLVAQFDSIESNIRKEEMKQSNHDAEINSKYSMAMAVYHDQLANINEKFNGLIQKQAMLKNEVSVNYAKADSVYSSYLMNLDSYEKEISKVAQMLNGEKESIAKLKAQEIELKKKIVVASEAKRLIKSYVLQTFQETLDLVGDMATEILSAIPNMSTSTVYFEGCKENKDGSLKDEVNAIINMDGTNAIPIKSLSGGERTTVDLAVDLAVIDIIEAKAGKGANFYVIDEPFDGLDSVCKENCLEILKQVDTNKKIIMVDHSSELKEMVSDVITVVKSGESSTVLS